MTDIVERLRAVMDDETAWRAAQAIIETQREEIERLRAALQRIANATGSPPQDLVWLLQDIAVEALRP